MNIKYGTWYLSELQTEFEGNEVLALAAYNAGRGNVYEWMEKYHWDIDFKDYTKIPFPETREYVKRVLENKKHPLQCSAKCGQTFVLKNHKFKIDIDLPVCGRNSAYAAFY